MIALGKFKWLILTILITVIFYGPIIYFCKIEDNKCDTTVTIDDGSEIRCKNVFTSRSGLTNLETCDNQNIEVPLNRILNIKYDKDE